MRHLTTSFLCTALLGAVMLCSACSRESTTTVAPPAPAKPTAAPSQPAQAPTISASAKAGKTPAKPAPALSADTLAQVVTLYNQMGTHYNAGVTARTAGDNAKAREHQGKAVDVLQQIDKLLEAPLLWQEEAEMEGWAQPAEYVQMAKEYGKVMSLAKSVRMGGGK
jgi:hypothetical protein